MTSVTIDSIKEMHRDFIKELGVLLIEDRLELLFALREDIKSGKDPLKMIEEAREEGRKGLEQLENY